MASSRNRSLKAYGLNELHLVVIHGRIRRVKSLLAGDNKKKIIDARDWEDTTPLMTAVLTGRLAIARLLLRNGAPSEAKDRRGRKALEYSRASLMKKKLLTYERMGLPPASNEQIRKRQPIAKILRYPAALQSCRRAGKHECYRAILYKNGRELNVLNPDITFKIAKENLERATSGFIASATRPEVKTAAASGWQPNPTKGHNVLDNARYIQLVQELARVLDFELVRSQRDNNGKHMPEHAGRFVASNTEKKLAVFCVVAALKGILGTTDLERVRELREAAIPEAWQEAWIFRDHTPCGNCWEFLHAIKRATGLRIYLETRPFLVKGNREGAAGCHNCPCHRCRQKFEFQPTPGSQLHSEERDKAGEDDDTEAENTTSDGDEAELGPDLSPGPDLGNGTDGLGLHENDGQSRRARGTTAFQPTASEPPKISYNATSTLTTTLTSPQRWKHFFSRTTGLYAKPIRRTSSDSAKALLDTSSPLHKGSHSGTPPSRQLVQAQVVTQTDKDQSVPAFGSHATPFSGRISPDRSTTELQDPPSMIAGRSGFFTTPEPRLTLQVQLPRMRPALQAEYDRVSDTSGTHSPGQRPGTPGSVPVESAAKETGKKKQRRTIRQAAAALNLKQFAYTASGPSAAGATTKMTGREREPKKAVVSGKVARAKKPRARVGRDDKLRAKSAFAKAVEHHQRKRAGNA